MLKLFIIGLWIWFNEIIMNVIVSFYWLFLLETWHISATILQFYRPFDEFILGECSFRLSRTSSRMNVTWFKRKIDILAKISNIMILSYGLSTPGDEEWITLSISLSLFSIQNISFRFSNIIMHNFPISNNNSTFAHIWIQNIFAW